MRIEKFSNDTNVYIPSSQYSYSQQLSYDEFLRRLTSATKVALLLTVESAGQQWITFSLRGSGPALTKIGALPQEGSQPQKSLAKSIGRRTPAESHVTPSLPANAKMNLLGNDWECVRGYRRSGNECVVVEVPSNAKLNVLGNDWECQRGYRISGSECVRVEIPANAKLNILGNDWECQRGFHQSEGQCVAVRVPQHAKLNILGNDWECIYGYRQAGEQCVPVGSVMQTR
jgi:hypothetical protein